MLVAAKRRCGGITPGKQCKGPLQLAPDAGDSNWAYVALGVFVEGDEQRRLQNTRRVTAHEAHTVSS
eukprot:6475566-Amphidinium_carterae.1